MLTGRYAFRTGVRTNGLGAQATAEKDGCVALRLKEAGYATAVAGKWRQLSHFTTKEDGVKWGFDEFLLWGANVRDDDADADATKAAKKAQKAAGEAKRSRYWAPDYNLNGKMLSDVDKKYGPDVLHEFVVDFIQRHKDEPFFVYYPTPLIHGPILATPDSKEPGDDKQKKAKLVTNAGEGSHYADNIAYLDKLIGKLVAHLDALKLREKTLSCSPATTAASPLAWLAAKRSMARRARCLKAAAGYRYSSIGQAPRPQVLSRKISWTSAIYIPRLSN